MDIQKTLWTVFSVSMQLQKHLVNKYQNEVERFVFCGLEKTNKISLAFLSLYPQINDNEEIEFSLGILARSVLMDMILVLEIKNTHKEYQHETTDILRQKLKNCCLKLINDGTKYFVEEIYSSQNLSDEEKKSKSKMFTSIFPNAFNESPDKPKLKKEYEFNLTKIGKDAKDTDPIFSNAIFNLYSYYSKYDHLSHWTSLSSHFPFEEKKGKLDLSIILMKQHLKDLIQIMIDYDDNYKDLQSYVNDLDILFSETSEVKNQKK
ncbi:MAG: hypothetical protein ABI237_08035 [Ginsengibacter sp.]